MEELTKHRLFWPFVIMTGFIVMVFGNSFLIKKQIQKELQNIQSPYSPSSQKPGLDYNKIEKPDKNMWN